MCDTAQCHIEAGDGLLRQHDEGRVGGSLLSSAEDLELDSILGEGGRSDGGGGNKREGQKRKSGHAGHYGRGLLIRH